MIQGVLLLMLGIYGVEDIRKRTITSGYLILFAIAGMGIHCYKGTVNLGTTLLGIAVGVGLLGLSVLTRESIGKGDGLIFLVTGIFLGGADNLELLFLSLLYAAIFSLGVLVMKRKSRKQEIPFVPFVFLGYLTIVLEAGL